MKCRRGKHGRNRNPQGAQDSSWSAFQTGIGYGEQTWKMGHFFCFLSGRGVIIPLVGIFLPGEIYPDPRGMCQIQPPCPGCFREPGAQCASGHSGVVEGHRFLERELGFSSPFWEEKLVCFFLLDLALRITKQTKSEEGIVWSFKHWGDIFKGSKE